MNDLEALKELQRQVDCWQQGIDFEYKIDPLKIAVAALKKQIPKNPVKVQVQPFYRKHFEDQYTCPVCRDIVKTKYCGNCGQKLNW